MIATQSFTHHVIPLLQPPGKPGAVGGKSHLAAIKAAGKSVYQVDRTLKLAGRDEIALLKPELDFFDLHTGMTAVRRLLVEIMRGTQRLRWLVLTARADNIRSCINEGIFGGVKNLCVGLVVDGLDDIEEKIGQLRAIPCQSHLLLLHSFDEPQLPLPCFDWLVLSTPIGDGTRIRAAMDACQTANVAFLHLDPHALHGVHASQDGQQTEAVWREHPFDSKIILRRPTLPGLEGPAQLVLAPICPRPLEAELSGPPESVPAIVATASDMAAKSATVEFEVTASSSPEANVTELQTRSAGKVVISPLDNPVAVEEGNDTVIVPIVRDEGAEAVTAETCGGASTTFADSIVTMAASHVALLPCTIESDHGNDLQEFHRLDGIVTTGLEAGMEASIALMEIRGRDLWMAAGYRSWNDYCEQVQGLTRQYANRMIKAAKTLVGLQQVETIVSTSRACLPQNEAQIKELYPLKIPERQAQACLRAAEHGQRPLTARSLSEAVAEIMAEDDPAPKVRSPDRKVRLAQFFKQLRAAVAANHSPDDLLGLIREIELIAK